jgi:hypothetical protein
VHSVLSDIPRELTPSSRQQIENIIGGMRGLKAMLWEGSVLDPNEVRKFPTHIKMSSRGLMSGWIGNPVSRFVYSRLPKSTAPRTWGERNHIRKYALATLDWPSPIA